LQNIELAGISQRVRWIFHNSAQPADEATEKRWQLIRQNRAFIAALHAALRSGSESAAGVQTGRRDADQHDAR